MLPVKDNIPNERFPLVTVTSIAILATAYLLSSDHEGLLPFLLDLLFLWSLGPSVEDALGRARFCVLCILGGLLGLAARALTGTGSPSHVLLGALGATAFVLGGYLLLHPRARVLTLVAVPFFTTIVEVPAVLAIGVWLALEIGLGVAGLG